MTAALAASRNGNHTRTIVVGSKRVEVACTGNGTAGYFERVAHTVTIGIDEDESVIARVARSTTGGWDDARAVVVGSKRVEVART